jgi:hypothetical protein
MPPPVFARRAALAARRGPRAADKPVEAARAARALPRAPSP